jgi:hypothetical protein
MHLQKALDSAVGAEFEMAYANDQIAIELVTNRNSLLVLLFLLEVIVYAPKIM